MEKQLFIKTKDKDVANQLKSLGYELLQNNGDEFVFLNDSKINFDGENIDKIITSNTLCI